MIRKFNRISISLSIGLILIFCGCTIPFDPSNKFNSGQATFYNPLTNEEKSIFIKNINHSGSNIYHGDFLELLVALHDSKGNPGVHFSLTLIITLLDDYTLLDSSDLTERLDLKLITNTSGVANATFVYNHSLWPFIATNSEVQFSILCPLITNTSAISEVFVLVPFDSEHAIYYDPTINATGSFLVQNLNVSGNTLYHGNQIEIIVGLKDSAGHPGIFLNLTVTLVFTYYGNPVGSVNLSEQLGLVFKTNSSGIAHLICTYDQYSWPQGIYEAKGYLEISSPKINNAVCNSQILLFCYRHRSLVRNTTDSEGLLAIDYLEGLNIMEEAMLLGGMNNTYINWTQHPFFEGANWPFINKTSLDYFIDYNVEPRITLSYIASAIFFNGTNLTFQFVKDAWDNYTDYIFWGTSDEYFYNVWLMSGFLSQLNITSGWLILQILDFDAFSTGLAAWYVFIYQIGFVSFDLELLWLNTYYSESMS